MLHQQEKYWSSLVWNGEDEATTHLKKIAANTDPTRQWMSVTAVLYTRDIYSFGKVGARRLRARHKGTEKLTAGEKQTSTLRIC